MSGEKVLIAAGGTGGHIYPALAMAEAFRSLKPDLEVEFVGTAHGLENKLIPMHGYKLHHLPVGRLNANVSLAERVFTVLRLPFAFIKSFFLLWKARPSFVLGVGGHASGPLLLIASICRYRTAIWEPNAMPGLANRILSRVVDECWVVFDDAKTFLKSRNARTAGMPVRREIEAMANSQSAAGGFFRVLVFGGSQGARSVNTTVAEMITTGGEWAKSFRFVHQTGAADYARVKAIYDSRGQGWPVDLREYLNDMGHQYANADLVICRSGTGTLSELAACGKPSILIPFPYASDDHQRKNAETLVREGAAVMILHEDLTVGRLREEIDRLRADPARLKEMSERVRDFHRPDAAKTLVRHFIERIENHASC